MVKGPVGKKRESTATAAGMAARMARAEAVVNCMVAIWMFVEVGLLKDYYVVERVTD